MGQVSCKNYTLQWIWFPYLSWKGTYLRSECILLACKCWVRACKSSGKCNSWTTRKEEFTRTLFAVKLSIILSALSKILPKCKKYAPIDWGSAKWLTRGQSDLRINYINVESENWKLCQFISVDMQKWQIIQIQYFCKVAFQYCVSFLFLLDQFLSQCRYRFVEWFVLIAHSENLEL